MGFLGKPFEHDLFVSYSHGAFNGTHNSDLKLWSQRFAADLRAELARTCEFREISVFLDEADRFDESVDRNEQLPDFLNGRVEASALFTLLMTQDYLRSKWCQQEMEWWCKKHHPCPLGAGARIYLCRVDPCDEATWPQPVKDVVGYFCYDRNKDPDNARPFTWRDSKRDLDDYNDLLVELSGAMMKRLRKVKAILKERRRQEELVARYAGAGQVLFLHARPQAAKAWEQACDRLQEEGYVVVPDKPVPLATEGLDLEYQKQLKKSDGLLLIGNEDGPAIDTDIVVIGRTCRELALTDKPFLPCALLDMVGEPLKTERRLRNARNARVSWIESTGDEWPNRVKSWLLEVSASMERVS